MDTLQFTQSFHFIQFKDFHYSKPLYWPTLTRSLTNHNLNYNFLGSFASLTPLNILLGISGIFFIFNQTKWWVHVFPNNIYPTLQSNTTWLDLKMNVKTNVDTRSNVEPKRNTWPEINLMTRINTSSTLCVL